MKTRTFYYILIGICIFLPISVLFVVINYLVLELGGTPDLILGLLTIIPTFFIFGIMIKGLLKEMKEIEKEKKR